MFKNLFPNFCKPTRIYKGGADTPKGPEAEVTFEAVSANGDPAKATEQAKAAGDKALRSARRPVDSDLVRAERVDALNQAKDMTASLRDTTEGKLDSEKRAIFREARRLKAKVAEYKDFSAAPVRKALYKDGSALMENLYKLGSIKYSEMAYFDKYKNIEGKKEVPNGLKIANAGLAQGIANSAPMPNLG